MSQEIRPIKFRAWEFQYNLMSEVTFIMFDTKELDCRHNSGEPKSFDCFEIMEFTGLHDKEGVEIYEGDVVFQDGNSFIVKKGIFEIDGWDIFGFNLFSEFIGSDKEGKKHIAGIKIRGNIYQHPELLKEITA